YVCLAAVGWAVRNLIYVGYTVTATLRRIPKLELVTAGAYIVAQPMIAGGAISACGGVVATTTCLIIVSHTATALCDAFAAYIIVYRNAPKLTSMAKTVTHKVAVAGVTTAAKVYALAKRNRDA